MRDYKCNCGEVDYKMFYPTNKAICKKCISVRNKEGYKLLGEESKKHYINVQKNWVKDNLIRYRFLSARYRAKKKAQEFSITEEDIKELLTSQDNKCYYLGIPFENNNDRYSLSIDRIDSSKGYCKDNIRLVASIVNYMKAEYSEEEFWKVIKLLYSNHFKE
jgi:hypothetical protein